MNLVLYEDSLKYDSWVKILIVFPVVLLVVLGILFYIDAHYSDVLPREPEGETHLASVILFASVFFVLIIYWLVLPTKIYVLQDRIKIKYGQFFWNVPFDSIKSVKAAEGMPLWNISGSVTSYSRQIEIVRKDRRNIRISPNRRDQFIECVNRTMSDWRRIQGDGDIY